MGYYQSFYLFFGLTEAPHLTVEETDKLWVWASRTLQTDNYHQDPMLPPNSPGLIDIMRLKFTSPSGRLRYFFVRLETYLTWSPYSGRCFTILLSWGYGWQPGDALLDCEKNP